MADPLSMVIATAVAGKAAESLTGQAGQAIAAIRRKIRERFRGDPDELQSPGAERGDPSAAAGLVRFLDAEFAADPAFRDEVRALWLQAAPAATDDAVSNVFYGKADKVVQLRDIHGDLNISLPVCKGIRVRATMTSSPFQPGSWSGIPSLSTAVRWPRTRIIRSSAAIPPSSSASSGEKAHRTARLSTSAPCSCSS